jgi:transcriptional regulator with XRE-family HTH domain
MPEQQLPPPVMKVLLGHELSRQREAAGVTQQRAAEVLRCTQQKIAHIEAGSGIRPLELDALLELYRSTDADRTYARDLQREASRRTKRGAFSTRFRQHMRLLVDMEPTCQTYCTYRSMVVPGLLQTEAYMRTLFRAWRPSPSPEQIDRDTENRLARQYVLENSEQSFWFILDEAALRRMAGGPEIMAQQIEHLVDLMDQPNIELQVVPFSVDYYTGQSHDLTIFGYQARTPVSVVFLEQYDGGVYVDDPKRTSQYLLLWDYLKAAASGPEQSRRLLLGVRESL